MLLNSRSGNMRQMQIETNKRATTVATAAGASSDLLEKKPGFLCNTRIHNWVWMAQERYSIERDRAHCTQLFTYGHNATQ